MLDPISAPRAPLHPARRRDHDHEPPVSAEVAQSLDYQLLRRTLNPDSEIRVSEAPAVSDSPAPGAALSSAAATSATSVSSDALTQQSQLNVTIGPAAKPQPVQQTDPLVLDLAGNGFTTRGLDDAVRFDLTGDGRPESISAPKGDDALLALDRNGNGRIDSGKELFGDQHGASNGFAELSKYDDNGDGRIDQQDSVFEQLSLLRFDAQGHQQQQTLAEAGVSAIHLQAQNVKQALGAYDEIAQIGRFDFADGRSGQAADLLLASR
ncbi:MAG: hypothetical protein U5M72_07955 [Pseudomonas sp.]|nr:hypothetical protein [Pseudomonas sp.]